MTPERHDEISRLFHAALEVEPAKRPEYLHRACAGDDELRKEVESLLALDEGTENFIEMPAWQVITVTSDGRNKTDEEVIKYCLQCGRQYKGVEKYCPDDDHPLSLQDPYHLVGRVLAGKYRIEALVGLGGVGAVYSALHVGIDRRVAFKILQPNVALGNKRMANLFEREAKVAGHLFHKNIVDVKDAGRTEDGIAYMVMEWLEGRTLEEELAEKGPLSLERTGEIIRQVTAALEAAHAERVVHRDLKPSNIMLVRGSQGQEQVKVVDFGIAKVLSDTIGSTVSQIMGTPHYASPEQLRVGVRIDGRSDIYSLGIMLYRMLAGVLPFEATSVHGLVRMQLSTPPLPLRKLRPELPVIVEQLIDWMLAKEASRRPHRASEVAEILDKSIHSQAGQTVATNLEASKPANRKEGPWGNRKSVGRQKELEELRACYETVKSEGGLLVCVTGEPGIGKTTIVEDFLRQIEDDREPCFIGRGRCSEQLGGTGAYLPFFEILESLVRSQGGDAMAHLMRQLAPTWYAQIAPISDDHSITVERKAVSQDQMKREVKLFFQESSTHQPLILALDDLHWADVSTIDLLTYLATGFDSTRMLVIATYRPSEMLLSKHPFLQVKPDLHVHGSCCEIALPFLGLDEVDSYLAMEFPVHSFSPELPALIHSRTEGNPLFMVDLIDYLRDRKVITEESGSWGMTQAISEVKGELPESVRGMIQRKIEQLSEENRQLLRAASVQGYEFDSAVLAKALELDAGEVEEQLEALDRIHSFVRLIGEQELPDMTLSLRYRFVHVLYQNVLYASLKPTRRVSLSAKVGDALLGHYGEKKSTVATRLAILYDAAREFSRATDYFLLAAQYAAGIFAYQEAIKLSRRGLELIKRLPVSAERINQEIGLQNTLGLASMAVKGYSAPEVEIAFNRARDLCMQAKDSPQIFHVLRGLGVFYCNRAKLDTARELGEQLLRLAQDQQNPSLTIESLLFQAFVLFFIGDFTSTLAHIEKALTLINQQPQHTRIISYTMDPKVGCLMINGNILWMLGYPDQALKRSDEAISLAQRLSHHFSHAVTLIWATTLHILRGEWKSGQEKIEKAIKLSQQNNFSNYISIGSIFNAYTLFMQGGGEEGIKLMREGLSAIATAGAEIDRPYYLVLLSESLGLAGQIEEGLSLINDAVDIVEGTPERCIYSEVYRIKGELSLMQLSNRKRSQSTVSDNRALNDIDQLKLEEAASCFRKAIDNAQLQRAKSLELRAVISLSRLLRMQGKNEEARQMLTEIYESFTEGFDTLDLKKARALLDDQTF